MEAYKTTTQYDESLQAWLKSLPLKIGQKIEIIVIPNKKNIYSKPKKNLLQGTVLKYKDPFDSVLPASEWEALK